MAATGTPDRMLGWHLNPDHPNALMPGNWDPEAVLEALVARGHALSLRSAWADWGSAQAVLVHRESGALMGAADPRRDGYAAGW